MALKPTIFKFAIALSVIDENQYLDLNLTVAQHPSETLERMMVRVLAYCLNLDDGLEFTRGLSENDEPDLWQRSLAGDITLWVEIGQLDEKRIKKGCARSERVIIYCFQHRAASVWWKQISDKLERFAHLSVFKLPEGISEQLASFAQRNMDLQCMVQDREIWFSSEDASVQFTLEELR
jgi:uncharacterized protein YaeQ